MYKQLNQASYLDKVVEMLDKVREEVIAMKKEVAATSTQTVEETTATVGETEIIEHEGLKLKRVDREAREGDYIRQIAKTESDYILRNVIYGPIENNQIKLANGTHWPLYNHNTNRTPSTVEVFEVVDVQAKKLPFPDVELTANQKRAKLIENAKKFVEEKKQTEPDVYSFKGRLVEANFHRKNKRVTCVVNDFIYGHTVNVGRADCSEGDVFNEHIGKAIALARTLEIDVPEELLNAVQPTEQCVGQIITFPKNGPWYMRHNYRIEDPTVSEGNLTVVYNSLEGMHVRVGKSAIGPFTKGVIIDDTHAQYEVVF